MLSRGVCLKKRRFDIKMNKQRKKIKVRCKNPACRAMASDESGYCSHYCHQVIAFNKELAKVTDNIGLTKNE